MSSSSISALSLGRRARCVVAVVEPVACAALSGGLEGVVALAADVRLSERVDLGVGVDAGLVQLGCEVVDEVGSVVVFEVARRV